MVRPREIVLSLTLLHSYSSRPRECQKTILCQPIKSQCKTISLFRQPLILLWRQNQHPLLTPAYTRINASEQAVVGNVSRDASGMSTVAATDASLKCTHRLRARSHTEREMEDGSGRLTDNPLRTSRRKHARSA